eukprot:TRINITY_DN7439_c1_g1_i1.p1 TRINITY_DN7439_c1_g1~~TRINITY_DN7439_c1_g1_i1.p1  ORF type:complete len:246 (-),score=60.28 TRINITY_DN7439_c1_g1_i1:383-1120(-)
MGEREDSVYVAKLAEQAERYDEMVQAMKKVAKMNVELTSEERNLLSVAYKNYIGARRSAFRMISNIEQKEKSKDHENNLKKIKEYSAKIESELHEIVRDVMDVIDNHLIPHATTEESNVFYFKMKGDYYRYMAEFTVDDKKKDAAQKSLDAYEKAWNTAEKHLKTTHPLRLGLALNYAVFYFEIFNEPAKACSLSKKAFDAAITELDDLTEDSYKDSTVIMQLIRDNLNMWTSSDTNDDDDEDDE